MSEQQKIESSDVTLKRLITELNYLFCVPNYQRHYVWTEKEVCLFLKDGEFCWKKYVEEHQIYEHFAGQLILRKMSKDRNHHMYMEIVDGQQRLTTFMLLVSVACRMMRQQCQDSKKADALVNEYFIAGAEFGESTRILKLSKTDQDFWDQIIDMEKEPGTCKPEAESHKHLKAAEKAIRNYLTLLTDGKDGVEKCKILKDYVDAISQSFRFVLLETSQPGYMYALYQIVNDRGLPLTSGELLKARTIELLSDKEALAKQAELIWDDILEDTGVVTERYLNWNYVAVMGKRMEAKGNGAIHEQYEREIFCCYNKRILSESEQLAVMKQLQQLDANVDRMRVLERGVLPFSGISEHTKVMYEALVTMLRNTFCIPLYLKILEMDEKMIGKTIENITPMLAKAFFIAKTMGGVHDTSIAHSYLEIWTYINRNCADMAGIRASLERLISKENCKKDFEQKVNQDIFAHGTVGNAKAKFLLLMLELQHYWKAESGKKECGDDSIKIQLKELSIEHILKDSVDEREVSKRFYNNRERLGNLTLIGKKLNGRLRDKDFEDKRNIYLDSPYWITREVGALEHWTGENFVTRQKCLISELGEAFKL